MSSSPTEAHVVDVTMPQMGVSVAEGTVVEWRKQAGDWVERDEIICAISTDKIDTDVESPAAGRVQRDPGRRWARRSRSARCSRGSRPTRKPGEAHRSELRRATRRPARARRPTATGEATAALEAPGAAGELQATPPRPSRGQRPGRAGRRAQRRPALLAGRAADRRRARDRPRARSQGTGRGGRVRKQDVLAVLGDAAAAEAAPEPPMHIETPVPARRAGRAAPRAPRFARRRSRAAPAAPPPSRRRPVRASGRCRACASRSGAHMLAVAADRGDLHDVDRGRHERASSRGPQRARGSRALPYVARATVETLREIPALNATLEGDTLTTLRRGPPRHRGLARRGAG